MKAHPVAEMFPLLDESSEQFKSLFASIDRNGQYDAIVIDDDGRILDGRNRWRVCELLKLEPKIVKFADLKLGKNEDGIDVLPEDFAFDRNFGRRDLTPDQRAVIGAQFEAYIVGGKRGAPVGNGYAAKDEKTKPTKSSALNSDRGAPEKNTRSKLAKKAGVSEHKAQQALDVARTDPALAKEVAAGKMKLNDAAKQTKAAKPPATTHMGNEAGLGRSAITAHSCWMTFNLDNSFVSGNRRRLDVLAPLALSCIWDSARDADRKQIWAKLLPTDSEIEFGSRDKASAKWLGAALIKVGDQLAEFKAKARRSA